MPPRLPPRLLALGFHLATVAAVVLLTGCGGTPSAANIKLRKELQQRDDQIESLKKQHLADVADIHAARANSPTTAALPPERLGQLFTVHGLSFGRLTGGVDLDEASPGDEGLRVYIVPTDDEGQPIKAAGSFHVEAFDLAAEGHVVGRWDFDTESARKKWFGSAMLYNYVLTCPWQGQVPTNPELTLRVTFKDELTGREFTEQRIVKVDLPPSK